MATSQLTRRTFLKASAAAAAAPYVVASTALGGEGALPASERIALGFIGLGGRGSDILKHFLQQGVSEAVAVCDVWKNRAEAWSKRLGGGVAAYQDFRDLIARSDIDAVVIATPDHWHVLQSIAAVRAGKDVFCEKPLAPTVREGRALCEAVERYGRIFLHGTHQRSFGPFRLACEIVRNGRIGKLHTIRVCERGSWADPVRQPQPVPPELDYDLWLGQAPEIPYVGQALDGGMWQCRSDYTAGWISGCGVHPLDIAQWGNGTDRTGPVEVEGRGVYPKDGFNDTAIDWHVEMTYSNGVRLIFTSTHNDVNSPEVGARFEGAEGWVMAHGNAFSIKAEPPSLLQTVIRPGEIHLPRSDNHATHFLECIRSRQETVAPAEVAHRSTTLCLISDIAMRLGRKLRWDPATETFSGDDEANRLLARSMRAPWTL
jgi:predicted dehydrogenase